MPSAFRSRGRCAPGGAPFQFPLRLPARLVPILQEWRQHCPPSPDNVVLPPAATRQYEPLKYHAFTLDYPQISTYLNNAQLAFENGPLAAELADRSGLEATNDNRARGDSNLRDWYVYSGLGITYIISRFSDCEEQYNWMKRRR